MKPEFYIPIIMLWVIIFILYRGRKNAVIVRNIIEKRRLGGAGEMKELAKNFIDKECLISSFEGHQYTGVIKEVSEGALLVEKDGRLEAINLDFIIRIREYPTKKNGKKKSLVLD